MFASIGELEMNITHPAVTAYRIRLEGCLAQWKGEGKNTITQEELCACMGVKVTQAFRRHVSEMQTDKMLTRFTYPTEKGGYKVAYLIA
jgi:hypothetical protein